jgi:hypothetical protein
MDRRDNRDLPALRQTMRTRNEMLQGSKVVFISLVSMET